MQRYFIQPEQFGADTVTITGDDAHHLIRVMRAKEGDRVIVSDGMSREARVVVRSLEGGQAVADIEELLALENEPAVDVWIAQSLPKGDKLELVIQKGTEIGASRFIPFTSERTVVQWDAKKEGKRLERLQKIAKEAAEQAHRNRVPEVSGVLSWKQLLQLVPDVDAAWFCYEKQNTQQLRSLIREAVASSGQPQAAETSLAGEAVAVTDSERPVDADAQAGGEAASSAASRRLRLLLIVGPEGGFTEKEAEAAEAAGCRAVSLGRRILRTETAAMVGLTCILYESGEMGGME
ncbi:16S rRNA (uracil(1498)-N(3))-methyltransferase [Paenibacillus sp. YYML68]|uniref:RsmE family RNA methyltransferase n=1 Tax=Paenibacillus sp. YYML68 TaxID=2909250 RepID=UPI0024907C6B|nr:RsmE family RNA methyltransferase [Paenibacillus sp. YYML68]